MHTIILIFGIHKVSWFQVERAGVSVLLAAVWLVNSSVLFYKVTRARACVCVCVCVCWRSSGGDKVSGAVCFMMTVPWPTKNGERHSRKVRL